MGKALRSIAFLILAGLIIIGACGEMGFGAPFSDGCVLDHICTTGGAEP